MTTNDTPVHKMNALEILNEVAAAEKENGCADRERMNALNFQLLALTGKTAAMLLDELGA